MPNQNNSTNTPKKYDAGDMYDLASLAESDMNWMCTAISHIRTEVVKLNKLAESFKDPYTGFFPPREAKSFAENVKGSFGGVGMNVGMKEGNVVVIAPLKDSPAMKAGIKAGDIITSVDGKNVLGVS